MFRHLYSRNSPLQLAVVTLAQIYLCGVAQGADQIVTFAKLASWARPQDNKVKVEVDLAVVPTVNVWVTCSMKDGSATAPKNFTAKSVKLTFRANTDKVLYAEFEINTKAANETGKYLETAYVELVGHLNAKIATTRMSVTFLANSYPDPVVFTQGGAGANKSNKYGDWLIAQANFDASAPGRQYESYFAIAFSPNNANVNAKKIAFLQIKEAWDTDKNQPVFQGVEQYRKAGDPQKNWALFQAYPRKYGWYGKLDCENCAMDPAYGVYGASPNPLEGAFTRYYVYGKTVNAEWYMETYAYGTTIYGGVSWGFTVNNGKLTANTPTFLGARSNNLDLCVTGWNTQTTLGLRSQMNESPIQVQLPALTGP